MLRLANFYRRYLINILFLILSVLPAMSIGSSADHSAKVIPLSTSLEKQPRFTTAFSPKQGATDLIVATIGKAKQSIKLAAYSFTSIDIANALINAKTRGIDVKVILDKSQNKDKFSVLGLLNEHDITIKISHKYSIMHNKFIIIDDNILQLGSFNYTKAAESRNAENVLIIENCSELVRQYQAQWQKIWDES